MAALAGCATSSRTTMLAPARPTIVSPEAVRLYQRPPKHFQEIALVEGTTISELRNKASAVGANGLLSNGVVRKPGPVIGVGIGTSTYHYGRHAAYGYDTSASFDVPVGGSNVLQATAIYVP
jgi:hypothetical protein